MEKNIYIEPETMKKAEANTAEAIREKYQSQEIKNKLAYISPYIAGGGNNPNYF